MTSHFGILSLLPPVLAVGLAIWKKQLLPSIFAGIWLGEMVLSHGRVFSAFVASFEACLKSLGDKVNLQIILFSLLAGSFLGLIKESNGIAGFINWFEKMKIFRGRRTAFPLTFLLNVSIFVDSWSSMLVAGSIMRPIYSRLKISRERLAYFLHTTSLNFVAIVVLNSWGAYYMSLLRAQNYENPFALIVKSIPFNYYCLASLILVMIVMATDLTIGPMKKAEKRALEAAGESAEEKIKAGSGIQPSREKIAPRASNLVLPLVTLITLVFVGLYISGDGDIIKGSGAAALFYAAGVTIILSSILYLARRTFKFQEIVDIIFKGMGDLLPIAALLVFALALGGVCRGLGTGVYLAELVKHNFPVFLLPAIIFAISCVISFATGTSYGTFAIMIPIAMPMAIAAGVNQPLMFGACISGGVFGDNCSPLSDTSIIASMVSETNVIDHVKTQIPYALISASIALVIFLIVGALV
jgi:tetracycline resistance efflux pump